MSSKTTITLAAALAVTLPSTIASQSQSDVGFYGHASVGSAGNPTIGSGGQPVLGQTVAAELSGAAPNAPSALFISALYAEIPLLDMMFLVHPAAGVSLPVGTDGSGQAALPVSLPPSPTLDGALLHTQYFVLDGGAPNGLAAQTRGMFWELGRQPGTVGFQSMNFHGETVVLDQLGPAPIVVTLNGSVTMTPDGHAHGNVHAIFRDGSDAMINFLGNDVHIMSNGHMLDLFASGPADLWMLDGQPIPVGPTVDQIVGELFSGQPAAAWSPMARGYTALAALTATAAFANNANAAVLAAASSPSWWCKAACGVAAGLLTAGAALGCGALLAGCAAGGTISFGGITFLCTPLIAACTAGTLATGAGAYAFALEFWN